MGAAASVYGRESELAVLADAIEHDRAIAVVGEAGIGKTTLVRAAAERSGRRLREGGGFATLRLLPYLALRRAVGDAIAGDPASAAAMLERLVGPDILFVDDAQWVDEDSLAAVELAIGRIMVVLAVRTGDTGSAAALALAARAGAGSLDVGPLADDAAEAIVRGRRPDLSRSKAAVVVARASGNPLLLEELAATGEPSTVLVRALASQLAMLGDEARQTVELVAVTERGLRREAVADAVTEAMAAGLIVENDGLVLIRHESVAAAIRERLGPAAIAALHERAAALVTDPLDRASHLIAAGRPDEAMRAALAALASTPDARDRAALLAFAAECAPASAGPDIRIGAARALDELSDWTAVRRVLSDGFESAGPEALVEREALLAHAAYAVGDLEEARARLAAAERHEVPAASDAGERLAIEAATFAVNVDGAVVAALERLARAAAAQVPGSSSARDVEVLSTAIRLLATGAGDATIILQGLAEAFARGRYRTASDRARIFNFMLLAGASGEESLAFLQAQTAAFEAAGVGAVAMEFRADAVRAAVLAGRPDQAIAIGDELAELPSPPRPRHLADVYRGRALGLLGSIDAANAVLEPATDVAWAADYFGRGEALGARADVAWLGGQPALAVELADAAIAVPAPVPTAHVKNRLVRAWALTDMERSEIGSLDETLSPSIAGARPEFDGLVAWSAGDPLRAAAEFRAAAATWGGYDIERRLVCEWAAGESLRRAVDPSAVDALRAALATAEAMRLEPIAVRIRRSLRLAGVRIRDKGRPGLVGAGGLTARERELVSLVERGLTNVEIARRLGLGRPTVSRILSSAMTKLGVSSRGQLVTTVQR